MASRFVAQAHNRKLFSSLGTVVFETASNVKLACDCLTYIKGSPAKTKTLHLLLLGLAVRYAFDLKLE